MSAMASDAGLGFGFGTPWAAQIEFLPSIDETRSYPRRTYACYRGGIIQSLRTTEPIEGDLVAAGWSVLIPAPPVIEMTQRDERHDLRGLGRHQQGGGEPVRPGRCCHPGGREHGALDRREPHRHLGDPARHVHDFDLIHANSTRGFAWKKA